MNEKQGANEATEKSRRELDSAEVTRLRSELGRVTRELEEARDALAQKEATLQRAMHDAQRAFARSRRTQTSS